MVVEPIHKTITRISMLKMHPKNVEIYGDEDVAALKQSIEESGWIKPLTVTPDYVIISGHRRYRAALELGYIEIPIEVETFASPEAEMERLLRENENRGKTPEQQIREGMTWEEVELAEERRGRPRKDGNISVFSGESRDIIARRVGLGSGKTYEKGKEVVEEIDRELTSGDFRQRGELLRVTLNEQSISAASNLFANMQKADEKAKQEAERKEAERLRQQELEQQRHLEALRKQNLLAPKGVRHGDLWKLGNHLLYCGDSASDTFINLCKQSEASFVFADPPYNAGVAEWDNYFEWKHDYLSEISPIVAVTPGISAIKDFMRCTSMPYKWSMSYWIDNGMTRGAVGFGNWIYVALFAQGSIYRNKQDLERIAIEEEDLERISITGNDHDTFKHKGRKPIAMLMHILSLFSERGQTVIDPFLGTGTTLIACERKERICVGAELDIESCEHIIKRWIIETDREVEKVEW